MDFSRLRQGEIVAGLAGLALIISMFLDWYGAGDESASGWDSLTDFDGFLIAAAGVAGITLALLAAAGRKVNLGGLPRGCATAALGALAVALIVWRMFADPFATGDPDLEFGLFLGLASAIGVTAGATLALREGGFEPLPVVPLTAARNAAPPTTGAQTATGARLSPAGSTTARKSSSRGGSRSSSGGKRSSSRSSGSPSRSSQSRKRSSDGRK